MTAPPPSSLKNLGPTSDRMLADVGIETADDLRSVGAEMAYRMVKHRHPGVTLHLLYALVGALADRHWAGFSAEEKAALRASADGDLDVGPGSS
ncbi:TfoX/Sxy family protein [Rubrivirga sp.]|uniref:TfoX/Sxy family protein n=1 Tax=Rubrivirga sp. TaxID=1885344 RepID=UPI003B522C46